MKLPRAGIEHSEVFGCIFGKLVHDICGVSKPPFRFRLRLRLANRLRLRCRRRLLRLLLLFPLPLGSYHSCSAVCSQGSCSADPNWCPAGEVVTAASTTMAIRYAHTTGVVEGGVQYNRVSEVVADRTQCAHIVRIAIEQESRHPQHQSPGWHAVWGRGLARWSPNPAATART